MSSTSNMKTGGRSASNSNFYQPLSDDTDHETLSNGCGPQPSTPVLSMSSAEHIRLFPNFCLPPISVPRRAAGGPSFSTSNQPHLRLPTPDLAAVSPLAQRYTTRLLSDPSSTHDFTIIPDLPGPPQKRPVPPDIHKPVPTPIPKPVTASPRSVTSDSDAPIFFYHKHPQRSASQPFPKPVQAPSDATLQTTLDAQPWVTPLPLQNLTHSALWLADATRSTTQKYKQHTADSVAALHASHSGLFFPDLNTIRTQVQRLDNILEIFTSDTAGRAVRAKATNKHTIATDYQLGLYVGHIRDHSYGLHDALLNHLDPDCHQHLDCTPPDSNSTAHILAMINEYIWLDDDIDPYPLRNNTRFDIAIPNLVKASKPIRPSSTLWLYYGELYNWDHLKWELVAHAIDIAEAVLLAYNTPTPDRWLSLLTETRAAHFSTALHRRQALHTYRSIPPPNPGATHTSAHLVRQLADIIDNTRYPTADLLAHPSSFHDLIPWLQHIASFSEFRWNTVFRRALSPPGHRISPYRDWQHFIDTHSTASIFFLNKPFLLISYTIQT